MSRTRPTGEDDLMLLIEALHGELEDALDSDDDMTVNGEPFNPRPAAQ